LKSKNEYNLKLQYKAGTVRKERIPKNVEVTVEMLKQIARTKFNAN